MTGEGISRREVLLSASCGVFGVLAGSVLQPSLWDLLATQKGLQQIAPTQAVIQGEGDKLQPTTVLSLKILQERVKEAVTARRKLPDELIKLGGMDRLYGFLLGSDGEVLLLGDRDASQPAVELESLVVALRNAYAVSAVYHGAPGCSIDPRPGDDPWRIQDVRVFGMPISCSMAARQVSIDYELKKAAAGIPVEGTKLLPSMFELKREADALCSRTSDSGQNIEEAHRYWFYPLLPSPPRFVREEHGACIRKPVGVQVLTEKEFLDRTGKRTGATTAGAEAQRFSEQVTRLLASQTVPRYAAIVNDFRIIELTKLLCYEKIPERSLAYLLHDFPLLEVQVPTVVGGISREEHGQVVCEGAVTKVATGLQYQQRVQKYSYEYRGGVEARIELSPEQFVTEPSGLLAQLRPRVLASRPSKHALVWQIAS